MTPPRPRSATAAQALRQSGLINLADLERAETLAHDQNIDLERATVALGLLSDDQVLYLVAETHGVDLVFPNAANVDAELLARFPLDLLRRHGAVPLIVEEGRAVVAFAEVPLAEALEEFAHHAGMPVRAVLASTRRLQNTLDKLLGVGVVDAARASSQDISGMTAFYRHLTAVFGMGADELRFEPSGTDVHVRSRRNGAIVEEGTEPAIVGPGIATRARLLANLPPSTSAQSGDLVAQIAGREVALRLAIVPVAAGELVVLERRSVFRRPVELENCGLPQDVVDWLRGPFGAPAGGEEAGSGLVMVAATDAELLHAFALAVFGGVERANAVTVVTRDARLEGQGRIRVTSPQEGLASTVRAVRATRPDVLFIDGGESADGLVEASCAALAGARVVFGMVDPRPADAVMAILDAESPHGRVHRALASVVVLGHYRALCRRCSRPDPQPDGWDGARVPVGCEKCDGRGFDGTQIVASGARAGPNVRASVVQGLTSHSPSDAGELPARLRELVTSGRVARADAGARVTSPDRR